MAPPDVFSTGTPREHVYRMRNLLAEVVTNLQNLASVDDVCVDWEVSVHQAHPVYQLMLDTIEEVTEEVADIEKHLDLLGGAKNMRAFTSLPEFATHTSKCNSFGSVGMSERVSWYCFF